MTLTLWPEHAGAQLASTVLPGAPGTAAEGAYEQTFTQLLDLQPDPERAADVADLVLQRDVARFTLRRG
ncbi:MAG: hypothetical protein ACREMX_02835 [Gemmatimonadales bacterium]